MIQQAHLGIGIKGREGSQAARAGDFAIPKFRDLEKLLFIHGRYSLIRNIKVIYASFYKNSMMFLPIVYFAFYSGASGQPLYDDWVMVFYNILFTSLPIFAIGIWEKDLHEYIIAKNPPIYRSQKHLSYVDLITWMFYAVVHSSVMWWTSFAIFHDGFILPTGKVAGLRSLGLMVMTTGLPVVYCKLWIESYTWILPWTHFLSLLSFLAFFLVIGIESLSVTFVPEQYKVMTHIYSSPILWFDVFLCLVLCLLPDVTFKYITRQVNPKAWQILQEKYMHLDLSQQVPYLPDMEYDDFQENQAFDDDKEIPLISRSDPIVDFDL
eukprot:TRINITY_DN12499_c0_g1_i4.p1 TRINITY_DN12499_c0_g1~~TRINITY_DN12499_c0_g1_i4.p1  ORF type:complete len:358 (-),score=66.19 TRINITY_DN12499_c0_g1_i4:191-1159(-)